MIAIIDYDAGNTASVEKACAYLKQEVRITRDRDEILKADHIILPGVGSFGDAMEHLEHYKLIPVIKEACEENIPFLGICLGLQLLFESSEESPGVPGLSILEGKIKRFPNEEGIKIPHIGWNSLDLINNGRLFEGMNNDSFVYFVHSYYLEAKDKSIVKATAEYGSTCIHASVESDNIFACQFHPEKSSSTGLQIINNFMKVR